MQMLERDYSPTEHQNLHLGFLHGTKKKSNSVVTYAEVHKYRGQPTCSLREKSVVSSSVFNILIAGMVTVAMLDYVTRQELEKRTMLVL